MKEVNNIEELNQNLITDLITNKGEPSECLWEAKVLFDIKLPLTIIQEPTIEIKIVSFFKCHFYYPVKLDNITQNITFEDCVFHSHVDAFNANFKGKTRFRNCKFKEEVNFRNTTFNGLADFWNSIFYKKTVFHKTDFFNTIVFSGVTFKENVLFTYTLIDKIIILRGTKPLKGLDLSLAIISGKLSIFDFKLRDFIGFNIIDKTKQKLKEEPNKSFHEVYEEIYEDSVSIQAEIPLRNKRETYRIIKDHLESQRNVSESLPYKLLEKETLRIELSNKKRSYNKDDKFKDKWEKFRYNVSTELDKLNLSLNRLSNNHGTSYGRALLFIALVGWFFFYCSLIATDSFQFSYEIREWEFSKGLSYFIQFLLPTHKFNYMGDEVVLTKCFYVFDFLGRTFVGYGIYQFIQAFRKFR